MWCTKCNCEFEDGVTFCVNCGRDLVEYEGILTPDAAQILLDGKTEDEALSVEDAVESLPFDAAPQLLMTVIGESEAKRVMVLLEDNRIPSCKKLSPKQSIPDFDLLDGEDDFDEDSFDNDDTDDKHENAQVYLKDDSVKDEFDENEDQNKAEPSSENEGGLSDEEYDPSEAFFDIFVPEVMFPDAMRIVLEYDARADDDDDIDIDDDDDEDEDF